MFFSGIVIALATFVIIGVFHPVVIKTEYYTGTKYWWIFLILGLSFTALSVIVENVIASSVLAVTGGSCLWTIKELFEQKERVEKGWFPKNPKRK
ncbi:MAG: DUF4491 family protein [Succinivibrio sp.]